MAHDGRYSKLELMQARVRFVPDGWAFNYVGKAFAIKNNLRKPINEDEREKNPGVYPYYGPTKIQGYIGTYEQDGSYALIGEDGDHFLKYKSQRMTQLVDGKCTVNNHAHIISGTEKTTREWFYYYFMHRDIFSFLSRQGAGRYKLNKASLERIPVLVPSVPEQKKIAQILSTWDKAISTTEQLLANSQQQKKALMQQLLTGKKRLLDKSGIKFSEWRFKKVGKFLKPYKELVPADTELPILTSSRTGLYEQERSVINEGSYGVLPKGYFTYRHMSDDLVFKFNFNQTWERGAISKEYPVFKTEGLDALFLEAQLNHGPAFRKFAIQQKQGGTRTRLYYKNLCDFGFEMPCLEEQRKIAKVLSTADHKITALQQKLCTLKQEKNALMQQLLTGRRRVAMN